MANFFPACFGHDNYAQVGTGEQVYIYRYICIYMSNGEINVCNIKISNVKLYLNPIRIKLVAISNLKNQKFNF